MGPISIERARELLVKSGVLSPGDRLVVITKGIVKKAYEAKLVRNDEEADFPDLAMADLAEEIIWGDGPRRNPGIGVIASLREQGTTPEEFAFNISEVYRSYRQDKTAFMRDTLTYIFTEIETNDLILSKLDTTTISSAFVRPLKNFDHLVNRMYLVDSWRDYVNWDNPQQWSDGKRDAVSFLCHVLERSKPGSIDPVAFDEWVYSNERILNVFMKSPKFKPRDPSTMRLF